MRVLFVVLCYVVAFLGLFVGGGVFVVVGAAEMMSDAERYDVQFGRPGDECDGGRLKVDVEDGTPLVCSVGRPLTQPEFARLPGFSDARQNEVEKIILSLGSDGLTEDEQQGIQAYVDGIADSMPTVREGDVLPGPYGAQRIVVGVIMLVVFGIGYLLLGRTSP